jgi:hypothetical protein
VVEWARRAERRGFSTLGTIDRLVYDNYEPLATLAAAAVVTNTIRLTTSILLGPLRSNHALFAKQAATARRGCWRWVILRSATEAPTTRATTSATTTRSRAHTPSASPRGR